MRSLCALFQATVAARGDAAALSMSGHPGLTWKQYGDAVRRLAPGFASMGAGRGSRVALLIGPRPEFHVVDTALLHAGAVPFSLHEGDPVDSMVRHLRLAEVRLLVTERRFLEVALSVAREHGDLSAVVCVDAPEPVPEHADVLSLDAVAARSAPDFDGLWRAVEADDVATLIFTSGTTGEPKAVQLSHRAIAVSEQSTHALAPFHEPHGTVLSYLPMGHIAERFMSHYASIVFGVTVRSIPDPATLYDDIATVRPIRFFGVPRVYEKLVDRARAEVDTDPLLTSAFSDSLARVRAQQSGRTVTPEQDAAADRGVVALAGVRHRLGLDRAEYLGVATAPSAYAMLEQLLALGLMVSDLWGMSECIMCTLNPPEAIRLGTVGVFLDGVEGRIAEDGEILVRGPNAFSGYLGDPERTAEIRDHDGWIHTGDVGQIDNGYLTIRGRKKELLITAAGRNIAPAVVEGAIKAASPLVDHVVAIADGRRHVAALVALDPEELAAWSERTGHSGGFADLAGLQEVRALVTEAVAAGNASVPRAETVRTFAIAPVPWLPGSDELTATSKLRRAAISEKYAVEIESLYE